MTTNLLPGDEDGYCGPIVHELHRIANDLIDVASFELPEPRQFELNIQPGGESDQEIIEAVNAIGLTLLNTKGEYDTVNGRPWYSASGFRGPVKISVYRGLAQAPDERDAELARLRAEVEQLRAQVPAPVPSGEVADEPLVTGDELVWDRDDAAEPTFRFGANDHLPLHFAGVALMAPCGVDVANPPTGHGSMSQWDRVTCTACLAEKPASADESGAAAGGAWVRGGPASIDPDSSMEAHYDAETDAPPMHYLLSGHLVCGVELTDDAHFSMLRAQVTCSDCRAATAPKASE